MILIWSTLTIPKHIIHLFPFFISLQRDDHSCWNFFVDLLRTSDFGAFQIALACSVICCSDFVIQERSFLIWGRSEFVRRSWIMIPICWMLFVVSWRIFSNNRWRPFRSWPCYLIVTKRRYQNSKSSGGLPKANGKYGNQSDFKSK